MRTCYHVGLLMRDRLTDPGLHEEAHKQWLRYELGAVALVQRKLGPNQYEYHAVPTRRERAGNV